MIYFALKRAILESGLKQTFIARKVGLDPTLFSKKINRYRPMTQKEKEKLAKILGKRITELFPTGDEAF
jgi:hypothetical protein